MRNTVASQGLSVSTSTPAGLLQSVDRALMVLSAYGVDKTEWGVTEIARHFGWGTTVAHRLLATLAHRGFLTVGENGRYRLGPAAQQFAESTTFADSWSLLMPYLSSLSAAIRGTALIALVDAYHVRAVLVADSPLSHLRFHPHVGEVYPAHSGATSKACFAFLPAQRRLEALTERPLHRFTPRTVTEPDQLEREFRAIRRQGFAATIGEYDPDIAAVAAPLFIGGTVRGSLTLAGTPSDLGNHTAEHVRIVKRAAASIGERLSMLTTGCSRPVTLQQ